MVQLLRADYDQLNEVSQTFDRESNDINRSVAGLQRQIEALEGGGWIGVGATAFYREMHSEVMPAMQRLVNALHLASRLTQQVSRKIQEAEEACAHLFSRDSAIGDDVTGDFQRAGDIAMGELAGLGGQAGAAGGESGGASGPATPEQAAPGGGGGGTGGGAGGGGSGGGGGGSWDGEIGFKPEAPPKDSQATNPSRSRRRRSGR
jgi:WXG100 family type VII secretion target